jgi:hypothetical protein
MYSTSLGAMDLSLLNSMAPNFRPGKDFDFIARLIMSFFLSYYRGWHRLIFWSVS